MTRARIPHDPARPRVLVLSTVHDVADGRLHRICAALRDAGADVRLEGVGDASAGPPGVEVVARDRGGALTRLSRAIVGPRGHRDHVLVVVDPEVVLPAWLWTRWQRRPLVVDVHEDYRRVASDRSWIPRPARRLAELLVALVLRVAARAELTSVADEHVPPHDARRRLVIRNLPVRGELPGPSRPAAAPRAVYVGDVRPSRGLWDMLEAVAAAPGWELDVIGAVSDADEAELRHRLDELDLRQRVRFHGRRPPGASWELAARAWVGLALLHPTPAYQQAVPTKVYEYLAVGVPVLASDLPRVEALLARSHAGVTAASADEAGARLRAWSHPGGPSTELQRLRDAASRWSRQLPDRSPFSELADEIVRLADAEPQSTPTEER